MSVHSTRPAPVEPSAEDETFTMAYTPKCPKCGTVYSLTSPPFGACPECLIQTMRNSLVESRGFTHGNAEHMARLCVIGTKPDAHNRNPLLLDLALGYLDLQDKLAAALRSEPRPQPTSEELRDKLEALYNVAWQIGATQIAHSGLTEEECPACVGKRTALTAVESLFARSQGYTRDEVLRIATAAATMHNGYPGKGWPAADAALMAIEAERSPKEEG